jgi:hypothetical protein
MKIQGVSVSQNQPTLQERPLHFKMWLFRGFVLAIFSQNFIFFSSNLEGGFLDVQSPKLKKLSSANY